MGNEISQLGNESIESFQWSTLDNRDLYVELSSPSYSSNKDLCKKVCQNSQKSQILPLLMHQIASSWSQEILCSNLLQLLKHFLLFIFSEKIPYTFLFEGNKKATQQVYENSFHRLVPCSFVFQGLTKTVYISVPQTNEFDRKKEQEHVIETIKSHFPEVEEYLLKHNERIYLTDENGKIVGIEEIFKHYNSGCAGEELVDPFKAQTKHFSVFRAVIRTMECDLSSPMGEFLKGLVEKLLESPLETHIFRTHAAVEVLLAMLGSQLYWIDRPIGRIEYKLFKHSPAVDILMNLPLETAQMLSRILLEYSSLHWKAPVKVSIFTSILSSYLDLRLVDLQTKTPQLAAYLLLLLNSYGRTPNPFRIQNWEMKWEPVGKFLFSHLDTTIGLVLFTEILTRNSTFYNYILSLSEPETFLEPLLGEIYEKKVTNERIYLIMVNLLVLSKDKIFIKFINKDIFLSTVSWLKEYNITKISLGSLMFLSLTKLLRENLRNDKLDYLHVVTIGCLFNVSQSIISLNELPSIEYLSLCKALYSKYCKLLNKETSELPLFTDLLHLTIEILCRILNVGLSFNPHLVQAVLHYSELFIKLKASSIRNKNILALNECIEMLMKNIDSENVKESILINCRNHSFSNFQPEILNCKEFVYLENSEKWEEFIVPHLWMDATKTVFKVPNLSRAVLFRHS